MYLSKDLKSSVIVLTGATSGIGKELANFLIATEATVVLHGRSQDKLDALLEELSSTDILNLIHGV